MKLLRSARFLLFALLLCVVPASSYAGVFISVGFAPPVLPVYEQPLCPEEGWMWMPGYWAYGDDGYYWVPGSWVPAPYEGALWTPPYWGWSSGFYMFHPGYWGRHVGYYGGVNYGFGYMGIGFVGGRWHGHDFEYNRAVMRVDDRFRHRSYEDRDIVNRYTVERNSRVAYSGGPGGIRHEPGRDERMAEREQHTGITSYQQQHESAARSDRNSYFRNNNGRPSNLAVERPLGGGMQQNHGFSNGSQPGAQNGPAGRTNFQRPLGPNTEQQVRQPYQNREPQAPGTMIRQQGGPAYQPNSQAPQQYNQRPANQPQYQPRANPQPQYQPRPNPPQQYSPRPTAQPQYQQRPSPQPQYQPRPNPPQQYNQRPTSQPQYQPRPSPQPRNEPQARPAPQPRPESHPQPAPRNDREHR